MRMSDGTNKAITYLLTYLYRSTIDLHYTKSNNNNNNNTQLVTHHMSVNAYSYVYERTESQARTGGLSVTVGFIIQMSFKLFFERLLC